MSTTTKAKRAKPSAKRKPLMAVVPDTVVQKPTNAELVARRDAAVARGVASAAPIYADHAENAELWDVEGNRYVDFAGASEFSFSASAI